MTPFAEAAECCQCKTLPRRGFGNYERMDCDQ
jgi:hypothetical protein